MSLWQKVIRERAVIAGFACSILQGLIAGELTAETALPLVTGFILRFLVTPANEVEG